MEFKKFLIAIDKAVPNNLDVHLICENLATHKTKAINDWLTKHPRFHMHFTPTGSSWINQVERWFGLLTDQLLRRGVHKSVAALGKRRPQLDHRMERQPKTVPLDQNRRRNPRLPRRIYGEDFRRATLDIVFMHVAPPPRFAVLQGLHDRMPTGMKVRGGVPHR